MVNNPKTVGSAILLGTLGVISFIVQPAEVAGLTSDLMISDAAANALVGYEMAGIALATIVIACIGRRFNWRLLLTGSVALGVIGDLFSAALSHSTWLGLMRGLSGVGHGGMISLSFAFIGLTRHVERNLALLLVLLLTYGAIGILGMPWLLAQVHFSGLFLLFATGTALGFFTLPYVPSSHKERQTPSATARQLAPPMLVFALMAVLSYNIAMGAAWANLALIGTRAGLPSTGVTHALAVSQFIAIGGALASLVLAVRLGRNLSILLGTLTSAACIAALIGSPGLATYMLAVCALNFAWNFVQPFILATAGDFDANDRMMSAAVAVQMIGLSLGPIMSSWLIGTTGYNFLEEVCILFFLFSYIFMFVPMNSHRKIIKLESLV